MPIYVLWIQFRYFDFMPVYSVERTEEGRIELITYLKRCKKNGSGFVRHEIRNGTA